MGEKYFSSQLKDKVFLMDVTHLLMLASAYLIGSRLVHRF